MVKLCDKTMKSCKAGEFFATNQWKFGADQMEKLDKNLNAFDRNEYCANRIIIFTSLIFSIQISSKRQVNKMGRIH